MTAPLKLTCSACQRVLDTPFLIDQHNISCAYKQERSYHCAANVPTRTVTAPRIPQGSGAHGREGLS